VKARVRAARADDARAIAEVQVEGWRWGYRGLLPQAELDALDVREREGKWAEWLGPSAPPGHFVFVAEDDAGCSGFVSAGVARDDGAAGAAEVFALYLAERAAGRGVGHALLERAHEELASRGHAEVFLWVLGSNARARAFYERHGYAPDGAEKREEKRCGAEVQVRLRARLG